MFLVAFLCLLVCLSALENISLHIIIVIYPMFKLKEHHNIGDNLQQCRQTYQNEMVDCFFAIKFCELLRPTTLGNIVLLMKTTA